MDKRFDVIAYEPTTQRPVHWPSGAVVRPQRFGWRVIGGCRDAEIEITGDTGALYSLTGWAGYHILIRNATGRAVWWGYVEDVTVDLGGVSLGTSLETMYNRIAVAYTYVDEEGATQRATTDWLDDTASQARYGKKELLYSRSDLDSEAAADDLAATLLAQLANPAPVMRGGQGSNRALLRCRGWWETVRWRYYSQLEGREVWDTVGAQNQVVGVTASSDQIQFATATKRVYNVGGQHGFRAGDFVVVSGTGSNNGTFEIVRATPVDLVTYTASTISFNSVGGEANDIRDSANGFDDFRDGDIIQIAGSTSNDGMTEIDEVEEEGVAGGSDFDHIETVESRVTETAGSSITIARRGYFQVKEAVVNEGWGTTYTIQAWGQAVAQKFSLEHDTGSSWPLYEVKIRAKITGSPADNLYVSLYSDNSGVPGTGIETIAVAASTMITSYQWVSFAFSGNNSLSYGTDYWLVVGRSGSSAADDFYELSFDDSNEYPRGEVMLHDGTTWQARPVAGTINFQVLGKQDTGSQIQRILADVCDHIDSVDSYTSGVVQYQYRDPDNPDIAMDEIERLLELGNSSNGRIVVDVSEERRAVIAARPAFSASYESYRIDEQGAVTDRFGRALEPGTPLAGKWVELDVAGLPDALANAHRFYVESADYSVADGRWSLQPEGAPDPWSIAALQQG